QHDGWILTEKRPRKAGGFLRLRRREMARLSQRGDELLDGFGVRCDQVFPRVQRAADVVRPDILRERENLAELSQLRLRAERLGDDERRDSSARERLDHLGWRKLRQLHVAFGIEPLAREESAEQEIVRGKAAGNGDRLASEIAQLPDVVRGQEDTSIAVSEQDDLDRNAFLPKGEADWRERERGLETACLERLRELGPARELHGFQGELLELRPRGRDDGEVIRDRQVPEADPHPGALSFGSEREQHHRGGAGPCEAKQISSAHRRRAIFLDR